MEGRYIRHKYTGWKYQEDLLESGITATRVGS